VIVAGNSAQYTFAFPFVGDSSSNISVSYINASGTQTALSPSQYTLALNAAAANQLWGVGGTVTYPLVGPAIATGTYLLIQRTLPLTQEVSVQNQGNYYAQVIEQALDIIEMQLQQVSARTGQLRGVWATGVQYGYGDIVIDGANGNGTGNYYLCVIANTSTTWAADLAAGDWSLVISVTAPTLTLPVSIGQGGTGATDAATARSNLGITSNTFTTEATIASASTTNLGSLSSNIVAVSGTTTINSFGSSASTANPLYFVRFTGSLTITYNATSMILPGSVSISGSAGDSGIFEYIGSGNWRCLSYQRSNGQSLSMTGANATFASATTTDIGFGSLTNNVTISGTTTITSLGTSATNASPIYFVKFSGALILTHNATSLILPGAANITTAAGDCAIFEALGSGNWRCLNYMKANGQAVSGGVSATPITNSLSADVTLSNTGAYFDGPSVAQGSTGTWFVSGTVTVAEASNNSDTFYAKLWDGTTVIASAVFTSATITPYTYSISLSGFISAPAGNLRISVRDTVSTNGKIVFNSSGNSKDSTISAFKIA